VTRNKLNLLARPPLSAGLLAFVLILDQSTKLLALDLLGDNVFMGQMRSDHARRILGDFVWLFVAYNPGAAFSMTPQTLVPFLPPTLFYVLLTAGAGWFLVRLWIRKRDPIVRTGAALVLSGALGNLLDRLRISHVVDFISVGVPGVTWRWPTFNIADSAICVGVVVLLWGESRIQSRQDHRDARHVPPPGPEETRQAVP
jgi:signal peptidase II